MITIISMHDAVCDFLKEKIASRFTLKTVDINGEESFKNPDVIRSGWILPRSIGFDYAEVEDTKEADDIEDEFVEDDESPLLSDSESMEEVFPYILPRIRIAEGVKNERMSVVTLDVLFGVYDPGTYYKGKFVDDGSGYRDLWNLIEATRQAFFTHMLIDKKYMILDDFFEAEIIQEQVYPYWEGYCRTKWHVAFPPPKLDTSFF